MSSEEDLENVELAVQQATFWFMIRRGLTVIALAALLMGIELSILIGAVVGALSLTGSWMWGALAALASTLGFRAWRIHCNIKRKPEKPERVWSMILKVISLVSNVLLVPAFMLLMPLTWAIVAAVLVTFAEMGGWLLLIGPVGKSLRRMQNMIDGGEPQTWEV